MFALIVGGSHPRLVLAAHQPDQLVLTLTSPIADLALSFAVCVYGKTKT